MSNNVQVTENIFKVSIDSINPAAYNPRKIKLQNKEALKNSLLTFGQLEYLVVSQDMELISGHQRYEVMKELEFTEVIVEVMELTDIQRKALNLALNSKTMRGVYDDTKLVQMLRDLEREADYDKLGLRAIEPQIMREPEQDANTNREKLDKFKAGKVKQVVLYYKPEIYGNVMHRIKKVKTENNLGTNTEVFNFLLHNFLTNHGPKKNTPQ